MSEPLKPWFFLSALIAKSFTLTSNEQFLRSFPLFDCDLSYSRHIQEKDFEHNNIAVVKGFLTIR